MSEKFDLEWVTPELHVPGADLRFFVKLSEPDAVLATILTWLGMEKRRDELVFELHERKHLAATEDDWYDVAGETYREFLVVLADPAERSLYERYVLERFFSRFNEPAAQASLGFTARRPQASGSLTESRVPFIAGCDWPRGSELPPVENPNRQAGGV